MIGVNRQCPYCTPGEPLGSYRCDECKRVYQMHVAAEIQDHARLLSQRWIAAAAPKLRHQVLEVPSEYPMDDPT